MRVDEKGRDGAAADEYRRALLRSARDQAVSEAEQEVSYAWAVELARLRHTTQDAVATARAAARTARAVVRAEQDSGEIQALIEAQSRLDRAEAQERRSAEAARTLLEVIADELELMALAGEERDLVACANRARVRSAWDAVRGTKRRPDGRSAT